jgi:hypothetical protein
MGAVAGIFTKILLCPNERKQSDGTSTVDCQMRLFVSMKLSLLMGIIGEAREISNPPYQSETDGWCGHARGGVKCESCNGMGSHACS